MRDWLKRNPVIAALALLAALLAAVLAVEISSGGPVQPSGGARRAVPAEAKLLPPMVAVAPEQAYPETAARPLFVPTRRPAPAVVAAPQPTIQRNQFVLLGVTIAGDIRIAMLRERTSGRLHRVEKGRDINGMKVAEIQPEMVTLAVGGEQEQLSLSAQKPGAAGQPAPAAPAAAPQGPFNLPPSPAAAPVAPAAPPPGAPAAPPPNVPQATEPRPGLQHPLIPPGPMPPGAAGQPGSTTAPQPSQAPMTPEELLERRRARRAQQTQ